MARLSARLMARLSARRRCGGRRTGGLAGFGLGSSCLSWTTRALAVGLGRGRGRRRWSRGRAGLVGLGGALARSPLHGRIEVWIVVPGGFRGGPRTRAASRLRFGHSTTASGTNGVRPIGHTLGVKLRRAARRCGTTRPVATGRWDRDGPGRRERAKCSCAGTRGTERMTVSLPATRLRVAGTAGGNTRRAILRSLDGPRWALPGRAPKGAPQRYIHRRGAVSIAPPDASRNPRLLPRRYRKGFSGREFPSLSAPDLLALWA